MFRDGTSSVNRLEGSSTKFLFLHLYRSSLGGGNNHWYLYLLSTRTNKKGLNSILVFQVGCVEGLGGTRV